MVSNTRRNNEDNESSSQQNSFQGFTFGHTQLSGQNASTINNSIHLPNVGSSQGSSHTSVQNTTRNTGHTPTTVLGEGNASDYLQGNLNNVNTSSSQQNSYDSRTNSNNRTNNTMPQGANNSVHNSDMIYNRPDYNLKPRSNTGFQFAINNSNNNPQTAGNNSFQENNTTPGGLINLFSSNTGFSQQNNNNNANRNEVDFRINNVVAEECFNMYPN
ncbi:hypothetical protein ABK040_005998 [Willaertia magna]